MCIRDRCYTNNVLLVCSLSLSMLGLPNSQCSFLQNLFVDVYKRQEYVIEGEGYIQTAERKYFDGREYLHHFCILSFTLSGLQSLRCV